ncbi:MAG: hypothetical protein Q9186_004144 [Xanthomendoza sp. 1 TL-2023]
MEATNTKSSYLVQVFELGSPATSSSTASLPKLPSPDRGKDAWLFLCGCFIVEAFSILIRNHFCWHWGRRSCHSTGHELGIAQIWGEDCIADMGSVIGECSVPQALRIMLILGKVVLTAPPLYFVKSRIPASLQNKPAWNQRINLSFLRQPIFWFMEIGNVFQGIGLFIPIVFLPTFASSIGLSETASSLTLSLLNAASVIGQILLGALTDKYAVTNIILISTLSSTLSIFLVWGFSTSMAPLYVFSLLYGLFAGGFSSCWAAMISEIRHKDPTIDPGLAFGLLSVGRGVGCVICGSLSTLLLKYGEGGWGDVGAYGTGFGLLIVFTGVTALLAGMPGVGRALGLY